MQPICICITTFGAKSGERSRLCCRGARKVTDIGRSVRVVIRTKHSLPVSFLGCLERHEGFSFTMFRHSFATVSGAGRLRSWSILYISLTESPTRIDNFQHYPKLGLDRPILSHAQTKITLVLALIDELLWEERSQSQGVYWTKGLS